ncbi:Hydroxymethylglutaryl-CoA lyase [Ceratocystis fimbriata CBS 114723]|uniref:hydroxymethylglutaryl-CoA lyase n=1 Tax=Ceratocystis fimbriata CBS 114723 TaxID=1035309 RepID=A0A2C5WWL2_9PEZI|nr:Hydroxymethylglutaryl-CoA lyase [Ceratocystis fimbriata CBS 114723]
MRLSPLSKLLKCSYARARAPLLCRRTFATASSAGSSDRGVKIIEVGPRDGLQNEKQSISMETKLELLRRLGEAGLSTIEAGSFVSPKWVPQARMAESNDLLEGILEGKVLSPDPVCYSFLVPNMRGMQDMSAILGRNKGKFCTQLEPSENTATPEIEIAIFAAASEAFSQRNLNMDIATSLSKFSEVIAEAKAVGLRVRAYISVVLGCPFTGYDVKPVAVAEIARDLLEMGADEISLGDTTGMGTAPRTRELLQAMTAAGIRNEDLAMHFHDTRGQALVNTAIALEHGIRKFDSSVGGLGGCPYSPGATGNVATENMVYFLDSVGLETGVDLEAVADIGAWITGKLGKANEST